MAQQLIATYDLNGRKVTLDYAASCHNLTITLIETTGKMIGEVLIAAGEQSLPLTAEQKVAVIKGGKDPESRRSLGTYKGKGGILLPLDIIAGIDGHSVRIAADEKVAAEQKAAKIAAISGLDLLRAAHNDEARYAAQFERMMEDEGNDGARPPRPATGNVAALTALYPRAAAYILADDWSDAAHDVKASAGLIARQQILDGMDHDQAISEMQAAWSAHCAKTIWD
jgi:hypothetical protein